jgi:D-lactate dehydrogenase
MAGAVVGDAALGWLSGGAWKSPMPRAGQVAAQHGGGGDPVTSACGGRIFGPANAGEPQLADVVQTLLTRAGYAPRLPAGYDSLCCGQMLASKGLAAEADATAARLEAALTIASENGRYPIVMDASPCAARMQERLAGRPREVRPRRPAATPDVNWAGPVLHVNCSVRKNGSDGKLKALLAACADAIIEPAGVTCCGFAGDRGFSVPELNRHALRTINDELPPGCSCGVSTNRTCEIGLTAETGINYQSIAYLLEKCSRPQPTC